MFVYKGTYTFFDGIVFIIESSVLVPLCNKSTLH